MDSIVKEQTTLFEALKKQYPDSSHRTLEQWIISGRIFIDENCALKKNCPVLENQKITIGKREARWKYKGIQYLYVDRHLIVVDKPPHLLSVPSLDPEEASVLELIKEDFQSEAIYPAHRLDRECSGALLFARGKICEKRLEALFEKHDLEREYVALVEGRFFEKSGRWESYLYEKENYQVVISDARQGKLAITHFDLLRRSAKFSYLKLVLETGRKHQIRVHCKEAGFPITGDKRYGALLNPCKRMMLHARRLKLVHPFTKKSMEFIAPLPKPFLTLGFPKL